MKSHKGNGGIHKVTHNRNPADPESSRRKEGPRGKKLQLRRWGGLPTSFNISHLAGDTTAFAPGQKKLWTNANKNSDGLEWLEACGNVTGWGRGKGLEAGEKKAGKREGRDREKKSVSQDHPLQ